MTYILRRLAIGNLEDLKNPGREISSILNVAEEVDVEHKNVRYRKIPLKDGNPVPVEKMREAINWIKDQTASGNVLVACHYGVGRSVSIVIGYLCSIGFTYTEARELLLSKLPRIDPMPGLENTIRESLNN
jgi:protein-tyrosine phosphatase